MTARIGAADTPYQQNPRAAAFPARTAAARRIQEIPHMEQKQKCKIWFLKSHRNDGTAAAARQRSRGLGRFPDKRFTKIMRSRIFVSG